MRTLLPATLLLVCCERQLLVGDDSTNADELGSNRRVSPDAGCNIPDPKGVESGTVTAPENLVTGSCDAGPGSPRDFNSLAELASAVQGRWRICGNPGEPAWPQTAVAGDIVVLTLPSLISEAPNCDAYEIGTWQILRYAPDGGLLFGTPDGGPLLGTLHAVYQELHWSTGTGPDMIDKIYEVSAYAQGIGSFSTPVTFTDGPRTMQGISMVPAGP